MKHQKCITPNEYVNIYTEAVKYWGMKEFFIFLINQSIRNSLATAISNLSSKTLEDPIDGMNMGIIAASITTVNNLIQCEHKKIKSSKEFCISLCFIIRYFLSIGYKVRCSYYEKDEKNAEARLIVSAFDVEAKKDERTTYAMACCVPEIVVTEKDPMLIMTEIKKQLLNNMETKEINALPYESDPRVNAEEYKDRILHPEKYKDEE